MQYLPMAPLKRNHQHREYSTVISNLIENKRTLETYHIGCEAHLTLAHCLDYSTKFKIGDDAFPYLGRLQTPQPRRHLADHDSDTDHSFYTHTDSPLPIFIRHWTVVASTRSHKSRYRCNHPLKTSPLIFSLSVRCT
jgi:hypothetical protein